MNRSFPLSPSFPAVKPGFLAALVVILVMGILYLFSRIHYLLFHSIAEIFSITIGYAMFVVSWNARSKIGNPYLVYLGIAYLFIGIIDLFHTLSYPGMGIFTDYSYYANQLWIGARYMESLTLLLFFFLSGTKLRFPYSGVLIGYLGTTILLLATIFYWKIFPICFVEGQGLTPFKKISEYIISLILLGSLGLLYLKRKSFEPYIRQLLMWSILLTVLSELAFTFYISNYGFSNLVGHYLKIGSFYLIYKALIETGLLRPYALIFKELKENEQELKARIDELNLTKAELQKEIGTRIEAETQKEKVIADLLNSLNEVKTLSGLLPICASCKKIRDDQGYWNQIEAYIEHHTDALFSHSICPTCEEKLYGDTDWYRRMKKNREQNS